MIDYILYVFFVFPFRGSFSGRMLTEGPHTFVVVVCSTYFHHYDDFSLFTKTDVESLPLKSYPADNYVPSSCCPPAYAASGVYYQFYKTE